MTRTLKVEFRNIITTLCNTTAHSQVEKKLRLFQLKALLQADTDDGEERILADARLLFAAMHISASVSSAIQDAEDQGTILCASDALTRLKRNEQFKTLLDHCFDDARGLYGLTEIDKRWMYKADRGVLAKKASVITYTKYCIRVDANQSVRPVKETAKLLYGAEAHKGTGRQLVKDFKTLMTNRRQRLCFIHVSSLASFIHLARVDSRPQRMRRILHEQADDVDLFKRFFAQCAYVQKVMAFGKELTSREISQWAGVEPEYRGVEPITEQEVMAARRHDDAHLPA